MDIFTQLASKQDVTKFQNLHWSGGFKDYLDLVQADPRVAGSSFQRLYDMIMSYGTEEYTYLRNKLIHYKFFDDPFENGKDAIFGLDKPLMELVSIFESAAKRFGTEKRILLLHGPVGTAKSTIARLLKKGLEAYSQTPPGALYTFTLNGEVCPMHEDPLRLIPLEMRKDVAEQLKVHIEGLLCPSCRYNYNHLLDELHGDWAKMMSDYVTVHRIILSEKDRIGIGTFQPRDEKNQDSTDLTGDINYRKIAEYGSDSDPRAFNFDGELCIGNRGIVEFIEIFKLDVAFLYDLLTASQEHMIKPKKFAHTDIDEVILGHTNQAEFNRLLGNEFMEALRDRTVRVDIPYNIRFKNEVKIYERDFNSKSVVGKHIAPHALELAAYWAVLTRLEEPKQPSLTIMQKLKLYDGTLLPGYTEDSVRELQAESKNEGMMGVSPRYIQDKLSNALVSGESPHCVSPFLLLNEIERGLQHHTLITGTDQRKKLAMLLEIVKKEYDEIVKNEVQRAMTADEDAIKRLCGNYIDAIKAYVTKTKVKDPFTGQDVPPDEHLMRSIEERIEISEGRKDDFRREIMNFIGAMAIDGKKFMWDSNERLRKALELKLFEDQKNTIKLQSLVSNAIDKETQAKIDVVKQRLIDKYGYCETCATDILNYVASIFARGAS